MICSINLSKKRLCAHGNTPHERAAKCASNTAKHAEKGAHRRTSLGQGPSGKRHHFSKKHRNQSFEIVLHNGSNHCQYARARTIGSCYALTERWNSMKLASTLVFSPSGCKRQVHGLFFGFMDCQLSAQTKLDFLESESRVSLPRAPQGRDDWK